MKEEIRRKHLSAAGSMIDDETKNARIQRGRDEARACFAEMIKKLASSESSSLWTVCVYRYHHRIPLCRLPAVCAWGRRRRGRKKLCAHSTTYLCPSAITWRAPIRDIIAKWYTCVSYTCTMKGHNVCSWLPLGFYKVCGRSCIGKYCGDHLICLRKGSSGPKACVKCGIGVKCKIGLCMDCGHDQWAQYIAYRERQNRLAATQLEFSRLADIQM